jgi:NADPH:quinone reductase-like Zn-dependent oxidoreductase
MTSVPILIGGAAGATGTVATKLLLQMGFPVRAIVRGDDERAQSNGVVFGPFPPKISTCTRA